MTKILPQSWPPDYQQEYRNRYERLQSLMEDSDLVIGAWEFYKKPENWPMFVRDWMVTYDPRNIKNQHLPVNMPFIFFQRQEEFFQFLYGCYRDGESGLVEKCRDMGATWLCCAFSICVWLFSDGSSVGWGSRKQDLVDKIGDPDSIFEKMRMILDNLPHFFYPAGFSMDKHCSQMKIINPDTGSTITGEVGDNIGRGGRKSIYFKDESAHYERPEKIEAALSENTNCQIDLSSVNGTANIFARRRQAGQVWHPGCKIPSGTVRVLILDWREHPLKSQEWYDKKREKAEREGLMHIFAQEVDRDYAAAVEGILIPSPWVEAAVDLHKKFPHLADQMESGIAISGLDIADEGGDLNAQAVRKGITLKFLEQWPEGDTGETADTAIANCKMNKVMEFQYDCIGVGAGVKAETNRLKREKKLPKLLKIVPWNAAGKGKLMNDPDKPSVLGDKESPLNKDIYENLKAQAGWNLRRRFEKTYKMVTAGIEYPVEELVNIPSDIPHFSELKAQLSQPVRKSSSAGKMMIDKKPEGTRSPNLFDSMNIAYFPYKPKFGRIGTW